MDRHSVEILAFESSLRGALDRSEFEVHYQPKVSCRSGQMTGVEALVTCACTGKHGSVTISSTSAFGVTIPGSIDPWVAGTGTFGITAPCTIAFRVAGTFIVGLAITVSRAIAIGKHSAEHRAGSDCHKRDSDAWSRLCQAPTLTLDAKAGTSVVGSSNGVTGTLNVNFTGSDKGTVTYGLTVPANGNVFTLAGTAMQKDTFGFTAKGIVTSAQTTNGCSPKCDGALPGGASVIGAIGGTAASRAGVNYGFNTTAGTITGVVVFKP